MVDEFVGDFFDEDFDFISYSLLRFFFLLFCIDI